ncbi:unnamed protein product [Fraxinus pennsylvanica]|uniref:Uncharacterized protein n=1 Tax=Fraxinus pennsylvanica TaxID=56036 RepID=A0AAD1Z0Y9_9LAMI|nr:unnamed protein product [Fraxinus pennsylvanica]
MAEGTRFSQLSEVVTHLKNENAEMKEAQTRQQTLLEELVKQVGNLANNYTTISNTIATIPDKQSHPHHSNPSSSQNLEMPIEYNAGRENKAADALSRMGNVEQTINAVTLTKLETPWIDRVKKAYPADELLQGLLRQLQDGTLSDHKFQLWQGIKSRLQGTRVGTGRCREETQRGEMGVAELNEAPVKGDAERRTSPRVGRTAHRENDVA